jgi:uncharacterized protein YjbI with pentapeptide repeats
VDVMPMCWLKRGIWKVGIAIAGMLLLLVLMVWILASAVSAQEIAPGPDTPGTGTVQVTPTEDATVIALNQEKLVQEVQQLKNQNEQLKNQNEPDLFGWLRTNAAILFSTLVVVLGGLIGLWRWLGDRRSEREKRAEERFQTAVTGFGNEKEYAKIGPAIVLRTFLRPGYEQFYAQTLDLAVANLRLLKTSHLSEEPDGIPRSPEDPDNPLPLTPLSQALFVVFKEAFPLAREWVKQGSPSSRLQRTKSRLKRILLKKELFDPGSLNATRVQLNGAFLWKADLERINLAWSDMRDTDLSEAKLSGAWLWRSNLTKAKLYEADLRESNLGQDNLHEADLRKAKLGKACLWGADLHEADLSGADLSEATIRLADLSGADLHGADLSGADLHDATLSKAKLRCAKLMGVLISGADFVKQDYLSEADVKQVKLTEISSAKLSLNEPILSVTNRNASYWKELREWANHINDNHRVTNLSKADLSKAILCEADLTRADFRGVEGLTNEQLQAYKAKGAIIDEDYTTSSS